MGKKHFTKQQKFKNSIAKDSFLNRINNITYTTDVLIGNWYNNRIAKKGQYTAIAPGIATDNKYLNALSQYQADFIKPSTNNEALSDSYIEWRGMGYTNRSDSSQSCIRLHDSDMFVKNLTSTKDVFELKLQPLRASIKKDRLVDRTNDKDWTQTYGNATKTGIIEWKKYREYVNACKPEYETEYNGSYRPYNV